MCAWAALAPLCWKTRRNETCKFLWFALARRRSFHRAWQDRYAAREVRSDRGSCALGQVLPWIKLLIRRLGVWTSITVFTTQYSPWGGPLLSGRGDLSRHFHRDCGLGRASAGHCAVRYTKGRLWICHQRQHGIAADQRWRGFRAGRTIARDRH